MMRFVSENILGKEEYTPFTAMFLRRVTETEICLKKG